MRVSIPINAIKAHLRMKDFLRSFDSAPFKKRIFGLDNVMGILYFMVGVVSLRWSVSPQSWMKNRK